MAHDLTAFMQSVEKKISKFGHMIVHVFEEEDNPGHSYTVGLSANGWPELLLSGTVHETGQAVLNTIVEVLKGRGKMPGAGNFQSEVFLTTFELREIDITEHDGLLAVAQKRAEKADPPQTLRALQVLWPDTNGNFPWSAAYDGEQFPQVIYAHVERLN